MNSVRDAQRRHFLSPNAASGCIAVQPVARSPGSPVRSACAHPREAGALVVGRGFRIFVTVSRHVGSSNGIVPVSTWGVNCRSSQLTWAMSMSATPTGISRRFRNSSNLPPNAWEGGSREVSDERFQLSVPHSAFLHRPVS